MEGKLRSLKHKIQQETRSAYWSYVEKIILPESPESPQKGGNKQLWSFIKHRKVDSVSIAPLKDKGVLWNDPKDKAEILNTQFKSVFTKECPLDQEKSVHDDHPSASYPEIDELIITSSGVQTLLENLNPNKSMGPDELHPRVLKHLAAEIAPSLTVIYNKSLQTGEVPQDWRKANIAPIFKKGERYIAANYRPISLTCVASKIMEHIVTRHIVNHLERNGILYDYQHGFRARRSTETQLLTFVQELYDNLRDGKQTDVVLLDFAKAFDKVPHKKLVQKLRGYGITDSVNKWTESFLTDRQQRVVCDGVTSSWEHVASGVPQGSVIGPVLFLAYINDLPDGLQSQVRLFADDTVVYMAVSSPTDAALLQQDLYRLEEWENKWQLTFNPEKCNVLRMTRSTKQIDTEYTLHGQILKQLDSAKYLGVTIEQKLSWNEHIGNVVKKANSSTAFLRRNLQIPQAHIKANAYKTLVRPQVEYASVVWDPFTQANIDKIEMVQRRAARYVQNNYSRDASVSDMISKLGWRSLLQRRADNRLFMLYKIVNGIVAIDFSNKLVPVNRITRHSHPNSFILPSETKTFIQQSFLPRTIKQWNNLPAAVAAAPSLEAFKRGVAAISAH